MDKHDLNSIELLRIASDEDVLENLEQLLACLQDRNWPVFDGIVDRLSTLGSELVLPICRILEGGDSIWKANIIGHLIPAFSHVEQQLYSVPLEKVLAQYDENDLREGVIDFVEIQLSNSRKNT